MSRGEDLDRAMARWHLTPQEIRERPELERKLVELGAVPERPVTPEEREKAERVVEAFWNRVQEYRLPAFIDMVPTRIQYRWGAATRYRSRTTGRFVRPPWRR